mmetsp:Transcript_36878/g.115974  ORF Transcript_36878/g.115974 Transcript_36878/m.115974 type:complete len:128 (+) Transcript_36878:138-521(+)
MIDDDIWTGVSKQQSKIKCNCNGCHKKMGKNSLRLVGYKDDDSKVYMHLRCGMNLVGAKKVRANCGGGRAGSVMTANDFEKIRGYSELAEADKKKVRSVFWESIPRPPLTQHELEEERLAAVQRASC